jgi:glycosyltransferase involved in cell wall biosynthesis
MSDRKISVLIPCYNQARYLPQAIESVLAQRDADWELVVSDDASTDKSAEIIRSYAARDSRIRFHQHTRNLGMAANWNWCLTQAGGTYVKFLFGDDYFCEANALTGLAEPLDRDPKIVLTSSARLIVDETGRTRSVAGELGAHTPRVGRDVIVRCLLEGKNLIGEPSAVMFRRAAATRGFDASFRQLIDWEFWAYLLEQGDFGYIEKPLCAFRRHGAQQTAANQRTRKGEDEGLRLHLKYLSLLQDHRNQGGGSRHAMRRALFRGIYFARKKGGVRTPESREAERALMRELAPAWYAAYWLAHRFTKPLSNLRKVLLRSPHA